MGKQIVESMDDRATGIDVLPPIYEEGQQFPEEAEEALKGLGSIWDPKYKSKKGSK